MRVRRTASFLRLEGSAFGARAEAVVEIDRAAGDRNARGREPASVLIDDQALLVRAETDAHRFEWFALVRRGEVECIIANHRTVQRTHPSVTLEHNRLREIDLHFRIGSFTGEH